MLHHGWAQSPVSKAREGRLHQMRSYTGLVFGPSQREKLVSPVQREKGEGGGEKGGRSE